MLIRAKRVSAAPELSVYRLHGVEFAKYLLVSVFALSVDTGLLLVLAQHIHYLIAASIGFGIGAGVHYVLSVSFVFRRRKWQHRRWLESSAFVLVGLMALGVNLAVIAVGIEWLSLPLLPAKIGAAGFSFLFGFVARKVALF